MGKKPGGLSQGFKKMVNIPYHRLNVIDDYNNNMNNADIADQLRGTYRWDTFMRKRKWWWSIMFWCLEMLQTNAYVCYKKYMEMHHLEAISHYAFNKKIALAWLDPHNNWDKVRFAFSPNLPPPGKRKLSDDNMIKTRGMVRKMNKKTSSIHFH